MTFSNTANTLIVPSGAGTSDPQVAIGDELPPELVAQYGTGIAAAVIYRLNPTHYSYSAVVVYSGKSYRVDGFVNTAHTGGPTVVEMLAYEVPDGAGSTILDIGGLFQGPDIVRVTAQQLNALSIYASDVSRFDGNFTLAGPVNFIGPATTLKINTVWEPTVAQRSTVTAGPAGGSTFSQAVVFPRAFPAGVIPHVTANRTQAPAPTAGWNHQCINVTNTGFTLFGYGTANTFSVPYTWSAEVLASEVM